MEFYFCDSTGPRKANWEKSAQQQKYKTTESLDDMLQPDNRVTAKVRVHRKTKNKKALIREARSSRILTGSHSTMTQGGDGGHSEGSLSDKIRSTPALISHLLPGGDTQAA